MTKHFFSQRCALAIAEGRICTEDFTDQVRRRLWRVLREFDAPCRVRASRYDTYEIHSEASTEVHGTLLEAYEGQREPLPVIDAAYLQSATVPDILDVIEAWSEFLWESERRDFERAVNAVFASSQCPWLIADSRVFRIDLNFVSAEILAPAFAELTAERYRGALDELASASGAFTAGDYKASILAAAQSFESVAKSVLDVKTGNASQLVRQLRDTTLFSDLPAEVAASFPESVFMPLAFLRNKLAGHGQGVDVIEVPLRYAELAIHLAAVYDLFLVRAVADSQQSSSGRQQAIADDQDVPF